MYILHVHIHVHVLIPLCVLGGGGGGEGAGESELWCYLALKIIAYFTQVTQCKCTWYLSDDDMW